jgi:hypothetical protein
VWVWVRLSGCERGCDCVCVFVSVSVGVRAYGGAYVGEVMGVDFQVLNDCFTLCRKGACAGMQGGMGNFVAGNFVVVGCL